jgi:hypothetical protein
VTDVPPDRPPDMPPPATTARYHHHRFPGAIIRPGVWRSERFHLPSRAGPARWCARGRDVPDAALRPEGLQGGQADAQRRQRRRALPGDQWPTDVGWSLNL